MADCPERFCHCSSPPRKYHDAKPCQPNNHQDAKPYNPDHHQDAKPHHLDHHQDTKAYYPDPKPLPRSYRKPPPKASSGSARFCLCLVAFFVLLGIIALILYLVYRPSHPHFSVSSFAVLSLSNSTSPFTCISISAQVTILIQNHNKHASINYGCLSVFLSYRNQAITYASQLPALAQEPHSSMALSPVVGGGAAIPVSYDVMQGLMTDEANGLVGLRLVVQGRIRFQSGPFYGRWSPLYVRCDMLVASRQGFTGMKSPDARYVMCRKFKLSDLHQDSCYQN